MSTGTKTGLALSGGGYRATAFHLGTLKKLEEMKVLAKTNVISTISGGSITGACYCTHRGDFNSFYQSLYTGLQQKNVITKTLFSWLGLRMLFVILLLLGSICFFFTPWPWLFAVTWVAVIILLIKYQFAFIPISKRIEQVYDQFFYGKKTLGQLNEHPTLVIGSTNLQTARPFAFSRTHMGDSYYSYLHPPVKFSPEHFPIARAVMASSCVPFAFTPIAIDEQFFENPADATTYHPVLVDGGVYDNQGIHRIMQEGRYDCDFVITSDAGGGGNGELTFRNTFALLLETVNVFMARIKKVQMVQDIYNNSATVKKQIAYFSLGWDAEDCIPGFIRNLANKKITDAVIAAQELQPDWVQNPGKFAAEIKVHLEERTGYAVIPKPTATEKKIARTVSTNLTALSKEQVDCLIKQAEALTELQVKLYCPSLLVTTYP